MTEPVPDADHQAHLVARLEEVEAAVRELLRIEETECRQYERSRLDREAELKKLSRRVWLLRQTIIPERGT